jgi:predicted N-acetyltransferase YhbS
VSAIVDLNITFLADHPDLIDLLATWFHREWGGRGPTRSIEAIRKNLASRLNRDRLPLTYVARLNGELVGSASLKIREMETHPQYLYWLGAVYVATEFRNMGLGSQIVQHSIAEAKRLGVAELYLYTRQHEAFYTRFGWKPIDRPSYHGREVVIMKRELK